MYIHIYTVGVYIKKHIGKFMHIIIYDKYL